MKTEPRIKPKQKAEPAFVLRAERAMRRVAKNVRTQNRTLKIPLILWHDGKVVEKSA